jgi:hypothetical protein
VRGAGKRRRAASMTEAPGMPINAATDVLDFLTNGDVHHTNYFQNQRTLDFIAAKFAIPRVNGN